MSFLHMKGPFCRDCGLAMFRQMTSNTLAFGWWGWLSFFITPVVVLINLVRRGKVASLAAPQRVPGIVPQIPAPLNPGKPVLGRVRSWVGVAIVLAILIGFIAVVTSPTTTYNQVGGCTNNTEFVSCDSPHDGKIIDIVDNENQCPSRSDFVLTGDGRVYCGVND